MASPFTPNGKNTDLSSSLKKYLKTLQFFTAATQLKKNFPLSTLKKKKSLFIWHNDYLGTINELVLKMYYFRVKPREKENSVIYPKLNSPDSQHDTIHVRYVPFYVAKLVRSFSLSFKMNHAAQTIFYS